MTKAWVQNALAVVYSAWVREVISLGGNPDAPTDDEERLLFLRELQVVGPEEAYGAATWSAVRENSAGTLVKHLDGQHDQSEHGKWAQGRAPTASNTNANEALFDEVREQIGLGDGAMKDLNAKAIAARLAGAGATPEGLLALVALRPFAPEQYIIEDLATEDLPAYLTVLQIQTDKIGWKEVTEIVITDVPDAYRSRYPTTTLREDGEWQDGAVEVLGYQAVDRIMKDWAGTTQGPPAEAFARAAMEELGVDVSTPQSRYVVYELPAYYKMEGRLHDARKAIARAMYENTQAQLADLFPDSEYFVLYRGASHSDVVNRADETGDKSTMIPGGGSTAMHAIEYKPLSSWTSRERMANRFAESDLGEVVAGAVVPRARIFSTAFSGNGAFLESEMVVIGGPLNVAVTIPEYEETTALNPSYLRMRLASGAIGADDFIMIDGQPVPISKAVVAKHGDHDQSSHGNWSTGVKAKWGEGISSDGEVTVIDDEDLADLYENFTDVSLVPGERVMMMDGYQKGTMKDSVATSLARRIARELSYEELDLTFRHLAAQGVVRYHRDPVTNETVDLPKGAEVWVVREDNGSLQWYPAGSDAVLSQMESDVRVATLGSDESKELLAYQFANSVLAGWAYSSQSIPSQYMQQAVAEMFDIPVARERVPDSSWQEMGKAYRTVAEAMYRETQETLDTAYPDTDYIVLHRGGDDESRYTFDYENERGGAATIDLRPLASFTTNPDIVELFAGNPGAYDGFTAVVPKSRIFATAATGMGAADEYEFVVVGGTIRGNHRRTELSDELRAAMFYEEFVTVDGMPIPVAEL